MENEILEKIKKLPSEIRMKLEGEDFLNRLDYFDATHNIKGLSLLLQLILKEINYDGLKNSLNKMYGFDASRCENIAKELMDIAEAIGISLQGKKGAIPSFGTGYLPMAFSMADEKEIAGIVIPEGGIKNDWQSQARSIISAFKFNDPDQVINKRLENIVIAKLKDVRDDLETIDTLTRSRKVGGMELSDDQANRLLSLIKSSPMSVNIEDVRTEPIKQTIETAVAQTPKIEMENGLPVVRLPDDLMVKPELIDEEDLEEELIFQQLKENISNVRINEKKDVQEAVVEPEIKKENVLEVDESGDEKVASVSTPQIIPAPAITPKPEPFLTSKRLPSIPNIKNSSKPNLDGIKVTKSIMGPIDELEAMTLIEFRRLSSDPFQATNKIKEDIETLSKEGFDWRSEAIAAWHRSEVSKFYRLLGHVAMSEGKSVESVIGERLVSGKPTLSMNEFEAIMELNKLIRF